MLFFMLTGCFTNTVRFPPDFFDGWVDTWRIETGIQTETDTDAPGGDTDVVVPEGEVGTVDQAGVNCDPGGNVFLAEVRTFGWTNAAQLHISDATRLETLDMLLTDSHAAGAWDRYQAGPLTSDVADEDYAVGVNTTFACSDIDTLTFGVVITGRFGDITDCRVWGADATGLAQTLVDGDPDLESCNLL